MSSTLWRAYFDNDLEKFRGLLGLQQDEGAVKYAVGQELSAATPTSFDSGSYTRKQSITSTSVPVHGKNDIRVQLTKAQINSRLPSPSGASVATGLNILHHAATSNNATFVTALLEHPMVDVYLQDYESGWTALHRALYFGNVTVARSIMHHDGGRNGAVKVKDREGSSPFELFGATIQLEETDSQRRLRLARMSTEDDEEEEEKIPSIDRVLEVGDFQGEYLGDEVFCWGSNKNLSLGFADGDNRQYPERVYLSQTSKQDTSKDAVDVLRPLFIQDVQMSKFQTVILTTALCKNVWACGYGHGGRLGLGHESTEFTFREVPVPARIESIALGQDHVLAVAQNGDVYSWGSGRFGQLGYAVRMLKNDEEEPQLSPRQVLTNIRKEKIKGAAASRWHSVVYTEELLFVFGKNEGQLGLADSDARTLECQVTPRKVAVSLFSSNIDMVTATDKATVILLENHDVWILTNHEAMRVTFPFERFPNSNIRVTRPTSKHQSRPNFITKITSGGGTLAALSRMGDVFTLNADKAVRSSRSGVVAQRIWSLKKRHMAVRDVDVGQDGSVILCTEFGSVWERNKRTKAKDTLSLAQNSGAIGATTDRAKDYKFSRVPGLTKIIAVRSNAFGAYCALRKDVNIVRKRLHVRDGTLRNDVASLLSFRAAFSIPTQSSPATKEETTTSTSSNGDVLKWIMTEDAVKTAKVAIDDIDLSDFDAYIETTTKGSFPIPVHKFLLSSRSAVLHRLLRQASDNGRAELDGAVRVVQPKGERARVVVDNMDFLALLILVSYLYTDTLAAPWYQFSQPRARLSYFTKLRPEIAQVAKTLGMKELEDVTSALQQLQPTLNQDLERAFANESYFELGDMLLDLKDCSVKVHSSIMCARCPFFHALYRGASGRWLSTRAVEYNDDETQLVKVDLKHMPHDAMKLVLLYVYSDKGVGLFDHIYIDEEGLDGFLDIVVEVLSIANELMMERLAEVCQRVLGRFVNTRNAANLLMSVGECSVTSFKDVTLEYLCLNLETLLENRYLDELDEDMMDELDHVVQARQLAFMPQSRSNQAMNELIGRHVEFIENGEREREICLALLDVSASSTAGLDDDDLATSNSYKGKVDFKPAGLRRQRRKSSRLDDTANGKAASPVLRPSSSGVDMMFNMDDEEHLLLRALGTPPNRSKTQRDIVLTSPISSLPTNSSWADSRGNQIESIDEDMVTVKGLSPESKPLQIPVSGPGTPSEPAAVTPWHAKAAISSTKLDMKDIMSQASKGRTSNISLGLASPLSPAPVKEAGDRPIVSQYTPPIATKISQKERRRQQACQHQNALPTTPRTPELALDSPITPSPSPWKTPLSGQRVSLKEVLQSAPIAAISSPTVRVQNSGVINGPVPVVATASHLTSKPASKAQIPLSPKHSRGPIPKTRSVSATVAPTSQETTTNVSPAVRTPPPSNASTPAFPQSRHYTTAEAPTSQSARPSTRNRQSLPAVKVSVSSPPSSNDFPTLGSSRPVEPALQLSLQDIISQQQLEQDFIKGRIPRQSIEEIQQEQEFLLWWAREEERMKVADSEPGPITYGHSGGQRGRKPKRVRGSSRGRGGHVHDAGQAHGQQAGDASASQNINIVPSVRGRGRGRGGAVRSPVENRA